MHRAFVTLSCLAAVAFGASCTKVPIIDINTRFTLADVTWFEDEQTLFVFYEVGADEGLGPDSTVELKYRTDEREVVWTPLDQFAPVHTHLPVDCGPKRRCGSLSVHVQKPPREIGLRLRYHRSGPLAFDVRPLSHVVSIGPAHVGRSFVVYGVFDASNTRVQWRGRHQFPTITNERATELGLRRAFSVRDATFGELEVPADNPYGYGMSPICGTQFTSLPWSELGTEARAIFEPLPLPFSASAIGAVCAQSTVHDAVGDYSTVAIARKNPEVRPAFPALRTPVREATRLGWLLRPCNRVISQDHLDMQRQRLLLSGAPEVCVDDVNEPGLADRLVDAFRSRIDAQRVIGNDMVLTIALHHDDTTRTLNRAVERALSSILLPERDKPSPRVAGALVYDSLEYLPTRAELSALVLWCRGPRPMPPFNVEVGDCPVQPDLPTIALGPFTFTQLPVLSTRAEYLDFIAKYSKEQAGEVRSLTTLVPERSATTENVRFGAFGLVTFASDALITAAPTDAFSYCAGQSPTADTNVVFRPVGGGLEAVPLAVLPEVHRSSPLAPYRLGLTWDSQFLVRAKFEARVAVAATVVGFTIPFGIASDQERFFGAQRWEADTFPLADSLAQCTRWCDHPTFDSSGQYQPLVSFRDGFASQCYRPSPPSPDDVQATKDFPRDR